MRGYPLPTIHWYLDDEKLDYGDNVTASLSANGTVTLEIKRVRQDSFGTYKCYAENEHGSAVKFVKYEYAGITFIVILFSTIFLMPRNKDENELSHVTRKPVFGPCDQVRLKPACSPTETS